MPSTVTTANILVGAHSFFKVGPWVTAKGAGTLVDVGSTIGGVTLDVKTDFHDVIVDQKLGAVSSVPIKRSAEIKTTFAEATIDNLVTALGQPTANKSGTTPNFTLLVDFSATELYFQLQIVGKGLGSGGIRTITCWRCKIKDVAPIPFKKDGEQAFAVTFEVLEEVTGSGVDSIKIVES